MRCSVPFGETVPAVLTSEPSSTPAPPSVSPPARPRMPPPPSRSASPPCRWRSPVRARRAPTRRRQGRCRRRSRHRAQRPRGGRCGAAPVRPAAGVRRPLPPRPRPCLHSGECSVGRTARPIRPARSSPRGRRSGGRALEAPDQPARGDVHLRGVEQHETPSVVVVASCLTSVAPLSSWITPSPPPAVACAEVAAVIVSARPPSRSRRPAAGRAACPRRRPAARPRRRSRSCRRRSRSSRRS